MLELDHVIIGVTDPAAAASTLRKDFGVGAVPGGVHAGGTGNWLIPLQPPQYLELLYVADAHALAQGPSATLLTMDLTANPFLGWAIRTTALDAVAQRLKVEPVAGSVENPDGTFSRWRVVAEYSREVSSRPFFIEYEDPQNRRRGEWLERYRRAQHDVALHGFSWIEVGEEDDRLRAWLGDARLPVRLSAGVGIQSVAIASAAGQFVLRPGARFGVV